MKNEIISECQTVNALHVLHGSLRHCHHLASKSPSQLENDPVGIRGATIMLILAIVGLVDAITEQRKKVFA